MLELYHLLSLVPLLTESASETCLTLLFLRAATHRNFEQKKAENIWLRFASSAHLQQQTEQKAKIMAERWRQLSKHLLRKSSFKRV